MKNRKVILSFVLTSIIALFLTSFASAVVCGGETLCGSIINAPTQANAGSDLTVTFNVTYEGAATSTTLDFSGSTSNIGPWKSLPSSTISIQKDQTLTLSAVLNVEKTDSGVINAVVKARTSTGSTVDITVPAITIQNSPSLNISVKTDLALNQGGTITVTNTGNVPLNNILLSQSGAFTVTLSNSELSLLPGATSADITVTPTGDLTKLSFGSHDVTIQARDNIVGVQDSEVLSIGKSFCKNGNVGGNLEITNVDITSNGDDDFEWKPLDTIEVEVEVSNNGDDNVDNVVLRLGFFDSAGKDQANDLDFESEGDEEFEMGDLNDGDEDTFTFRFTIPPSLNDGTYKLALKAFGDKLGESKECADETDDFDDNFFQEIDVIKEDDEGKFIAFNNIEVSPTGDLTCGDSVTVDLDVYNIGDEDQDQVKISLVSSELNVRLEREIKSDLDQGDNDKVSFEFIIPNNAQNKLHRLQLSADYDYRSGTYRESSDESTGFTINVIGCNEKTPDEEEGIAVINAGFVEGSEAKPGEEMKIKASITSLSAGQKDFVVRAVGFDSWATLNSISERLINLKEGETKEVTLSFNINEDASGEQSFTIEVISGGASESREVAVNIEQASSGFSGFSFGDNNLIWIIGIINVVLIILIIIVAVRISRK